MSAAAIAVRDEAAALLPLLHSNRSAAYISLGRFAEALADATKTVELRSDWSKAYNRLAVANIGLGRFDDAFLSIRKGLEIEPQNIYIISTLVHALELVLAEMTVSEMIVKLQRDATLTGFLLKEEFFSKMKKLHGNPKSVQLYLSDQRMMRGLGMLLNVKSPQQAYCMPESSKSSLVIDRQMEVGDLQARALQEKDSGNAAYKKKNLETAIMHYSHGLELVSRVLYPETTACEKVTNITEDTFNANEIRVAVGGKFQSYITYANHLLQEKGKDEILFKAVGDAISKAVNIVEQLKRQVLGLHQNTAIRSIDVTDRHALLEKGLAPLDKSRRVSMIIITLSRKPLDISSPGYQPPFSTGQMNHNDSRRRGNSHAANNGYGNRCLNNFRGSNRSFNARGRGVQGRRKDGIKEGIRIVEPRPSYNDNNTALDEDNDEGGDNDTDDECVILDTNPFEEKTTNNIISLSNKDRNKIQLTFSLQQCLDEDELSVIAQRGQIACRDYPHSRHLCGVYPFSTTPHETYCSQCYCYVCDAPAPCKDWSGILDRHCNATESDPFWKMKRDAKKGTSVYELVQNHCFFSQNSA